MGTHAMIKDIESHNHVMHVGGKLEDRCTLGADNHHHTGLPGYSDRARQLVGHLRWYLYWH
jgi:hypothetical protein